MSTPQQSAKQPAKKASLITPSRIVLVVFLVGAVVALVLDFSARSKMNAAYNTAQGLVEGGANSPTAVQKKLNLKPSTQTKDGTGLVEEYIWPGAFYTYHVRLQYDKIGDQQWLSRASMKSVSRLPFLRVDDEDSGTGTPSGAGSGKPPTGDRPVTPPAGAPPAGTPAADGGAPGVRPDPGVAPDDDGADGAEGGQ